MDEKRKVTICVRLVDVLGQHNVADSFGGTDHLLSNGVVQEHASRVFVVSHLLPASKPILGGDPKKSTRHLPNEQRLRSTRNPLSVLLLELCRCLSNQRVDATADGVAWHWLFHVSKHGNLFDSLLDDSVLALLPL